MSSQLFGTDGIRGPAGEYPLNDEGMRQIGKAAGTYFAKSGGTVLVGWDPRESSEPLSKPLIDGLVAAGAQVVRVGVIPTPGLAYLTKQQGAAAGVIITASHNPYTDNGVKIFTPDGRKLPDETQAGLNDLIDTNIPEPGGGTVDDKPTLVKIYEDFLVSNAGSSAFQGLKLAVDTANGATSGIANGAFSALGAEVTTLFDKPDGRNINVNCGATDTGALETAVKDGSLNAGAALDGDGDRVMLADEKGRQLTGDHILYILAVAGAEKGVVATIMSNKGLESALAKHGIKLERADVGDRSVLHRMDETGFNLGGEQSGHIIIANRSTTGDGMLAAIRTLAAVQESGKPLSAWRDEVELLPQALVNIAVQDKSRLESPEIQAFIKEQTAVLDGGRLNIRASGTEPKARVMVEAADAEAKAQAIANALTKLLGEAS